MDWYLFVLIGLWTIGIIALIRAVYGVMTDRSLDHFIFNATLAVLTLPVPVLSLWLVAAWRLIGDRSPGGH
jgi:hypothetical protein